MCPTSNVNTGVAPTIAEHPIGMLRRLQFRVTVNTDNRLMSNTTMTNEMLELHKAFGWGLNDFQWLTVNAMKSAFAPFPGTIEADQRHHQAAVLGAQVRVRSRKLRSQS